MVRRTRRVGSQEPRVREPPPSTSVAFSSRPLPRTSTCSLLSGPRLSPHIATICGDRERPQEFRCISGSAGCSLLCISFCIPGSPPVGMLFFDVSLPSDVGGIAMDRSHRARSRELGKPSAIHLGLFVIYQDRSMLAPASSSSRSQIDNDLRRLRGTRSWVQQQLRSGLPRLLPLYPSWPLMDRLQADVSVRS
jgi:hypothetical protein